MANLRRTKFMLWEAYKHANYTPGSGTLNFRAPQKNICESWNLDHYTGSLNFIQYVIHDLIEI